MRRVDIILYIGILVLMLGLISYFISMEQPDTGRTPVEETSVEEIKIDPDTVSRKSSSGFFALILDRMSFLRREGSQLASRFWKDGLTEEQRLKLKSIEGNLERMREFILSLQFLIILLSTGFLVGLYHLYSSGKLRWPRKKASPSSQ